MQMLPMNRMTGITRSGIKTHKPAIRTESNGIVNVMKMVDVVE
jgi:hypothetical protein